MKFTTPYDTNLSKNKKNKLMTLENLDLEKKKLELEIETLKIAKKAHSFHVIASKAYFYKLKSDFKMEFIKHANGLDEIEDLEKREKIKDNLERWYLQFNPFFDSFSEEMEGFEENNN
jgi:hypothetical protein